MVHIYFMLMKQAVDDDYRAVMIKEIITSSVRPIWLMRSGVIVRGLPTFSD